MEAKVAKADSFNRLLHIGDHLGAMSATKSSRWQIAKLLLDRSAQEYRLMKLL